MHVCHSILHILYLSWFFFLSFFFFFSFSVFTYFVVILSYRLLLQCYWWSLSWSPLCTARPLFIVPTVTGFYHLVVWLRCPCRPLTGLSITQPPPLTCAGYAPNKEGYLVCLPTVLQCECSLSLPIPNGMHLVVPTHHYFFCAVCCPSKTFPSKEFEQEPQNRFSPLPIARPCPFTSDSWPHHFPYWLVAGWWCLGLAHASLPCIFEICLLLTRPPWSEDLSAHPTAHSSLLMAWTIFWLLIL